MTDTKLQVRISAARNSRIMSQGVSGKFCPTAACWGQFPVRGQFNLALTHANLVATSLFSEHASVRPRAGANHLKALMPLCSRYDKERFILDPLSRSILSSLALRQEIVPKHLLRVSMPGLSITLPVNQIDYGPHIAPALQGTGG
jgi:hypothetical protein